MDLVEAVDDDVEAPVWVAGSQPAVSFTHWRSGRIAVLVHGRARVLAPNDDGFVEIDRTYDANWWQPLRSGGEGVYLQITPATVLAWGADPGAFPE